MNSRWLEKHEEELKKIQGKSTGDKKKGLLIAVVILVVLAIFGLASSGTLDTLANPETMMSVAFIGGTLIFVFLMVALLSKKSTSKDAAKDLRKELENLLTSKEEVEQFDNEMLSKPLENLECGGTKREHIMITEHYIHHAFLDFTNLPDHRFVRLSDVYKMKYAIQKDETKALGLGKLYFIDLLDANGQKCMGVSMHGKEGKEQFEELLKKYCPNYEA